MNLTSISVSRPYYSMGSRTNNPQAASNRPNPSPSFGLSLDEQLREAKEIIENLNLQLKEVKAAQGPNVPLSKKVRAWAFGDAATESADNFF